MRIQHVIHIENAKWFNRIFIENINGTLMENDISHFNEEILMEPLSEANIHCDVRNMMVDYCEHNILVVLKDGSHGTARYKLGDTYNCVKGYLVAYCRAKGMNNDIIKGIAHTKYNNIVNNKFRDGDVLYTNNFRDVCNDMEKLGFILLGFKGVFDTEEISDNRFSVFCSYSYAERTTGQLMGRKMEFTSNTLKGVLGQMKRYVKDITINKEIFGKINNR